MGQPTLTQSPFKNFFYFNFRFIYFVIEKGQTKKIHLDNFLEIYKCACMLAL